MARKPIILVIEADRLCTELLAHAIAADAWEIIGASQSQEAIHLAQFHLPELVIVDVAVPGGPQLPDRIRKILPLAKILALTDSDEVRDSLRSRWIGIVDKRGPLSGLLDAVTHCLSLHRLPIVTGCLLVADSEEETAETLSHFLITSGYAAFCVATARETLEAVDRDPSISVIVLDMLTRNSGGLSTLSQILKRQPHPSVIVATVAGHDEIAAQALKLGAFDCLIKPINLTAFAPSISAAIGHFEYKQREFRAS